MFNMKIRRKLNESQESKSIAAAKKYWIDTHHQPDKFELVINELRGAVPVLRSKKGGKFILGTLRMWNQRQINKYRDFSDLNSILKIIVSAHIDEYDRNLNDMSLS